MRAHLLVACLALAAFAAGAPAAQACNLPCVPEGCVPDEGDRVCVTEEDGTTCVAAYQLTDPTDIGTVERVCHEAQPTGSCTTAVAGLGTFSGFYGTSAHACTGGSEPVCATVHVGFERIGPCDL